MKVISKRTRGLKSYNFTSRESRSLIELMLMSARMIENARLNNLSSRKLIESDNMRKYLHPISLNNSMILKARNKTHQHQMQHYNNLSQFEQVLAKNNDYNTSLAGRENFKYNELRLQTSRISR